MVSSNMRSYLATLGGAVGGGLLVFTATSGAKAGALGPEVTGFSAPTAAIFTLDEPIDPLTVVPGTSVQMMEPGVGLIPCTAVVGGAGSNKIVIAGQAQVGHIYHFILTTSVKDTSGRPLVSTCISPDNPI